jgi:hypothetical protein
MASVVTVDLRDCRQRVDTRRLLAAPMMLLQ